jgi:hypothetical protein
MKKRKGQIVKIYLSKCPFEAGGRGEFTYGKVIGVSSFEKQMATRIFVEEHLYVMPCEEPVTRPDLFRGRDQVSFIGDFEKYDRIEKEQV